MAELTTLFFLLQHSRMWLLYQTTPKSPRLSNVYPHACITASANRLQMQYLVVSQQIHTHKTPACQKFTFLKGSSDTKASALHLSNCMSMKVLLWNVFPVTLPASCENAHMKIFEQKKKYVVWESAMTTPTNIQSTFCIRNRHTL